MKRFSRIAAVAELTLKEYIRSQAIIAEALLAALYLAIFNNPRNGPIDWSSFFLTAGLWAVALAATTALRIGSRGATARQYLVVIKAGRAQTYLGTLSAVLAIDVFLVLVALAWALVAVRPEGGWSAAQVLAGACLLLAATVVSGVVSLFFSHINAGKTHHKVAGVLLLLLGVNNDFLAPYLADAGLPGVGRAVELALPPLRRDIASAMAGRADPMALGLSLAYFTLWLWFGVHRFRRRELTFAES